MKYYVFKFNLEPSVLRAYHYESQKENVINVVIPNELKKIFKSFENVDKNKIKFKDYIDIDYIKQSDEYNDMITLNSSMIRMYKNVVENHRQGKGITYTPEYLNKRKELKEAIERLVEIHPLLKSAFELSDSIYSVDAFESVKMSVAYIRKAKKIEYYVENFSEDISDMEFIYDTNKEYVYILAENKSDKEAMTIIDNLEEKINNLSFKTNIGRISINPIYENIALEGKYSEITIELVYPNGDRSRDVSRAIEEANAAKEKRTFKASKGDKIDAATLSDYFKKDAEKGYIQKITSRGKNIVKSFIKTVRF